MMPIYFNAASHLWIAYLFLFNGLLITFICKSVSEQFREITQTLEATILSGFFISLLFNGLLLLLIDSFNGSFSLANLILPIISCCLVLILFVMAKALKAENIFVIEMDFWRIGLYLFVFIILFYNGGHIEKATDSWWHMSLANKMAFESSFTLNNQAHLNGVAGRFYPPLWHGNLALMKVMSGISLPVTWNSFTAWGGVFKVMSFYLLALSLTKNKTTSFLSIVLFLLLSGPVSTYLRISAWPAQISCTALFSVLFVSLKLLQSPRVGHSLYSDLFYVLKERSAYIVCSIALCVVMFFTHLTELVWLAFALFFYVIALLVYSIIKRQEKFITQDLSACLVVVMTCVAALFLMLSLYRLNHLLNVGYLNKDKLVAFGLGSSGLLLFITLGLAYLCRGLSSLSNKGWTIFRYALLTLSLMFCVALILSIDVQQLLSLFQPEMSHVASGSLEEPLLAKGYFGENLRVPSWHFQLRGALLYSGITSIILSLVLVIYRPTLATLFLASNAIIPFLLFVSPYLYEWLNIVTGYHSLFRMGILIFTPIIFAMTILDLFERVKK